MTATSAPRRYPSRAMIAIAVLLVVGATGWVSWWMLASRAAAQVSTSWTLDCPGVAVRSYQGDPAIASRPGWRCQVQLTIRNDGNHPIDVSEIRAPLMGSHGGAEVQGFSTASARIEDFDMATGRPSTFGDVDARWKVDLSVPAHSSRTVPLEVGWRPSGCNVGGYLGIDDWPTVVFDVLGRGQEVSAQQRLMLRTFTDSHDARACR